MARLLDPKRRGQKKFPFEWRNSSATDVRLTWDRVKPGWNKPPEKKQPAIVRPIKKTA